MRNLIPGLVLLASAAFVPQLSSQQALDPLTGTWKGDWGPSSMDRNAVVLELKWDGKTLTGTVNPGPDAISIENESFDAEERKVHFEANLGARNRRYIVEGKLENNKITGSWRHERRAGDFQLTREATTEQSAPTPNRPNLAGLDPEERKVLEHLLDEWGKDFSVTSLDLAARSLGMQVSDEMRFRIGFYIQTHPELHEVIRRWGWQTLVLTPDEKLIARAIINQVRTKRKAPSLAEIARQVKITKKQTTAGLEMLGRFRVLRRDKAVGGVGYVAAEPRYLTWERWLDLQFHTVALSDGRLFNTN